MILILFVFFSTPIPIENREELLKEYNIVSPLLSGNPVDIGEKNYGKERHLISMNLLDEPVTIERFTKHVVHEYYGEDKDGFGNPYPIMLMNTPIGKTIFIGDPVWVRIIWNWEGDADFNAFGSFGSGNGEFKGIGDIDGKYPDLFITDTWNHRIQHWQVKIDSIYNNNLLKWIKFVREIEYINSFGEDKLSIPEGLDYSDGGTPGDKSDDLLYVADVETMIAKFKIDGTFMGSFGQKGRRRNGKGYFGAPVDIAVKKEDGLNTNDIYVVDYGNNCIINYPDGVDSESSEFYWNTYNYSRTNKFSLYTIDVDYFGYPYVTDSRDRIVKYKKDLSDTLWTYGSHGFGEGHFNGIHDIYIYQDELLATERWTDSSGISYYWIEAVTDTIPPVVRILSPPDTTYINGKIKIVGTAKDEYLKYWQVYQGEGEYPDTFELVDWDTEEKECAILTEWNTKSLSGIYSILLLARDEGGNLSTDTVRVWVSEPPVNLAIGSRGFGNGEFRLPVDVTVDAGNKVWITDTQNDRVQKFGSDGSFLLSFGKHGRSSGEFMKPSGIEPKEDKILVADINNSRIQIFNQKGEYLSEFGTHGSANGKFNHPFDLAVYGENIFVADRNNHRIQKFTGDGSFIGSFGSHGSDSGEFNNPSGIDIINEEIAVADRENDRVQILSLDGEVKKIIRNNFDRPYDVGFDSDSSLYVVDCNKHRVQKFDRYGNRLLTIYDDSLKLAKGCCMGDALWVTDTYNNRVVKFPGWFHLSNKSIFSLLKKNNSISYLYPNPCSQNTNIYLLLPEKIETDGEGKGKSSKFSRTSHSVKLAIYDLTGRKVKELYRGTINGSQHIFKWRLEDDRGRKVPSGCYFYYLHVDDDIKDTGKIIIVK